MHTVTTMAKELTFKMRLDAADKQRLDELAAHYSAPAATVLRILMKKEHDALVASQSVKKAKR